MTMGSDDEREQPEEHAEAGSVSPVADKEESNVEAVKEAEKAGDDAEKDGDDAEKDGDADGGGSEDGAAKEDDKDAAEKKEGVELTDIFGDDYEESEDEGEAAPAAKDSDDDSDAVEHRKKKKSKKLEKKKSKKDRKESKYAEQVEEEDEDPTVSRQRNADKVVDDMLRSMQTTKNKKSTKTEEQMMEDIEKFLGKLSAATEADKRANEKKLPATHKMGLLTEVITQMNKVHIQQGLLHNNLLAYLCDWLDPLPDGSSPPLQLRTEIYKALFKMPVSPDHLRACRNMGRRIMERSKARSEPLENRQLLQRLLEQWQRRVMGNTDNYREATDDMDNEVYVGSKSTIEKGVNKKRHGLDGKKASANVKPGDKEFTYHAMIPLRADFDYQKRPASEIDLENLQGAVKRRKDAIPESRQKLQKICDKSGRPIHKNLRAASVNIAIKPTT